MNNKGFTLTELLAVVAIMGVILGITIYMTKGTTATSLTQIEEASDNQIFDSARAYIMETNKAFNSDGYVCVLMQELVDYGYVKNTSDMDAIIKITRNRETKVIEEIKYVNSCN